MAMRRYADPWSTGPPSFDLSDRLNDQAAIRYQDLAAGVEPVEITADALDQPVSWSRTQDRPVRLRELMAAHYPASARRFSLEPSVDDPAEPLRVTRLSDQEFLKVTLARLEHGIHDFADLPGVVFARYPLQLLTNELELETIEGAQIVGMIAQRLALLETRLAADRVHLAPGRPS
jgi:hypothetical protein